MGGVDRGVGLYRIDVNVGLGSGVRITNVPPPGPFWESMRRGEQILFMHSKELVGDRDPREHEFTVQLRAFDAARRGAQLGLPALLALCGVLLGKSLKGGLIAVGGLTLGDGIEPVYDAISVAELAAEKGASVLLVPLSARKRMYELSDDIAASINIVYYRDARDALVKGLAD